MTTQDEPRTNVPARIGFAMLLGLTLPVFYYFFVVGGWITWFGVLLLLLIPELRLGYFGFVHAVHLLIYAPLLWLLAGWLLNIVHAFQTRKGRRVAAGVVVVVLLAMGFAPIHVLSHGREPGKSAYSLYFSILTKREM